MEKSEHYERNVKTVQALKDAGSDFQKLHAIEHHLYCSTDPHFNLPDYDGWGTEVEV